MNKPQMETSLIDHVAGCISNLMLDPEGYTLEDALTDNAHGWTYELPIQDRAIERHTGPLRTVDLTEAYRRAAEAE
jgi:hypothetical protein